MHLNNQAIRTYCYCRLSQRLYHPPHACCVARVHNNRQMAELLHSRNRAEVQRITRVCFEGTDTTLAEDNIFIALTHNVFCRHQPLLNRRSQTTLQQNRLIGFAQFLEQLKVLHIARADLNQVNILNKALYHVRRHDFRNNRQTGLCLSCLQKIQALLLQSLEGVRRGTRLESTATHQRCACCLHILSNACNLLLRFHRARTGNNLQLFAAEGYAADINNAVLRMEHAVRTLERLLHAHNLFYAFINTQKIDVERARIADYAEQRGVDAFAGMNLEALAFQLLLNLGFFCYGCVLFEYNNHDKFLLFTNLQIYNTTL